MGSTSLMPLQSFVIPFQVTAPSASIVFWPLLLGLYLAFLLISLWVFQDTRIRGMKGPYWLLLVFLVPILGLVVYLIFRRERPA